jgi:hypothetical protein
MVSKGEFGVSIRDKAVLSSVVKGDYVFAYQLKPVRGVVGVFEATSTMYEEPSDDNYPYPYRIHLRPVKMLSGDNEALAPFPSERDVQIDPAFTLHSIVSIPKSHGESLLRRLEVG